ncbi:hypothetical protein C2857_002973 [Epichloe festucae Fl1]|uniref:Uncharacterized protein n=1 Tax=Epichloe festucae (strain Fl1) TaxID=877507 RepID=A0A7U3Q328_EPIFF|nr:hypothetical protein C2857_002973 [Epichloe festucae Fl1]
MPPVSRRLSSETMGLSEGIINNSQQSPRHLTRSRVEDILGSSTDEKIDKLLAALEGTLIKQQDAMRTHSFQIVRLQNQIQDLQNAKSHQDDNKEEILEELNRSRMEIAYLKGRLAGLTVEFYSTKVDNHGSNDNELVKRSTQDQLVDVSANEELARSQQMKSGPLEPLENMILEASGAAEAVADRLLNEQRPKLIKALETFYRAPQPPCGPGQNVWGTENKENVVPREPDYAERYHCVAGALPGGGVWH